MAAFGLRSRSRAMQIPPWLVLFALSLAPIGTAHAAGAVEPWDPIPPQAWEAAARPDSGGRDAIILFEEGLLEDREGAFRLTVFRRIKVFTEEGRDAGKVEIPYRRGDSKIEGIRARSVRIDGASTELSTGQIVTSIILKSAGTEYNQASFIVPGIEPGCIVEYRYSLSGKQDAFWAWPWYFQNEHYTVESRLRWKPSEWATSSGMRPHWVVRRIPEVLVSRSCVPDCDRPRELTFTLLRIPGPRDEEMRPPREDVGPHVVTSYVGARTTPLEYWSWWKRSLDAIAAGFSRNLGPLKAVIEKVRQDHADSWEALAEVHVWLRENVRSSAELSWQDLQGKLKPRSFWGTAQTVAEMIANREGSPYEICLAYAAAAKALGLEACVVLVRDRREGAFDYRVIGFIPTNAIAAVRSSEGGRWRFHSPASRFAARENLPWYYRGGYGLVAGPGQSLFLKLQPEDGPAGHSSWTVDLRLDETGSLEGRFSGSLHGEESRAMRAWLHGENPESWRELLAKSLAPELKSGLDMEAPDIGGSPDSALILHGTLRFPSLASSAGSLLSLSMAPLTPWRFHGGFDTERRSQPVFFRFARSERVVVNLRLPEGATLETLPSGGKLETGLGRWTSTWSRSEGGVRYERLVEMPWAELPALDYPEVQKFFRSLGQDDEEVLVVRRP